MTTRQWAFAFLAVAACGVLAVVWTLSEAPAVEGVVLARPAARPPIAAPSATGSAPLSTLPGVDVEAVPNPRFQLLRVVLPSGTGADRVAEASIAVDGHRPSMYRVGDVVVGAVVLQSVQPDAAVLGPAGGPAAVVLKTGSTAPPSASTGVPPAAAGAIDRPAIFPANTPAVDRSPVPVTDPDHGADTSNH